MTNEKAVRLVEEIESLERQLYDLCEAEAMAKSAMPAHLGQIRALIYSLLDDVYLIASKFTRKTARLSGIGPEPSLEALERYFHSLRNMTENQLVRSIKSTGPQADKARKAAEKLAILTREAALSLRFSAQKKGRWSEEYGRQHGLDNWL